VVSESDIGSRCPAHSVRLGYVVFWFWHLMLGRDVPVYDVCLGYVVFEPSSYLILGRDAPVYDVCLGYTVSESDVGLRCPAYSVRLGYAVSESRSLTLGCDVLCIMRLGYVLS